MRNRTILSLIVILCSFSTKAQVYVQTSAGFQYGIALRSDSTIWAWGFNGNGQLGTGGTTTMTSPIKVDSANKWIAVEAGGFHRLSIAKDSTIWGCGLNGNGQLGLPPSLNNYTAIQLSTQHWRSISAGLINSAAIRNDGSLWVCGSNYYGLLGTGDTISQNGFVRIGTDTTWKSVSISYKHILATKSDNTLWGWGDNSNGQLGIGNTMTGYLSPTKLDTSKCCIDIGVGFDFSVVIKNDSTIYSTGINSYYQLGRPTAGNLDSAFKQVGTSHWRKISVGSAFAFSINNRNQLYGWGANADGQLGMTSATTINLPTQVSTDTTWYAIASAKGAISTTNMPLGTFAIGIKRPRKGLCTAGTNANGELGIGSTGSPQDYFDCGVAPLPLQLLNVSRPDIIDIFPNPASGFFNVSNNNLYSITVYQIDGKLLKQIICDESKIQRVSLDSFKGVLTVRIQTKGGATYFKSLISY